MELYQHNAVVLQCGADSLSGDWLGCLNLSATCFADCLSFLRSYNVPLMVLGWGGYTMSMLFAVGVISKSQVQEEEDMDERPKPRIWDGEGYGSDHDEGEKTLYR
ncbi:hypothetical protein SAY86_025220 [Trapa natans]|uniref:Histone deacetylase domain-containing protein n=1 Tax=Trapa natans TaxID=22666 RepID=A0AAN7MQN1_TRANT|nr:hypothetical protein SAY86_025220 [Trapa natans]